MRGMNPNIVIVLHSPEIQLWQFETIQSLLQQSQSTLHILISPVSETKESFLQRAFKTYSQLDTKVFAKKLPQENAQTPKSVRDLPEGIAVYTEYQDLPTAFDLAVYLELDAPALAMLSINATEYWFPKLSESIELPAFHVMGNQSASLGVQIVSYRSSRPFEPNKLYDSSTAVHHYSYYGTLNPCLWKLRHAFNRLLSDYVKSFNYSPSLAETVAKRVVTEGTLPTVKTLNLVSFISFLMQIFYRFVLHKVRSLLCNEQFVMAYRKRSDSLLSHGNLNGFKLIEPPPSEFWADPFVFTHQNKTYLFFENLEFSTGVGKLSVLNLSDLDKGRDVVPVDILVTPYHLSYPQVFEDNGQIYMLPETTGNNAVELYVAEEFPVKWKKSAILLDNIKAHDATLLKKDALYWLFVNVESKNAPFNDELSVFSADSLKGEWQVHPLNPIATYVESARSGGRIHYDGEKLLRPSQDCSVCYGYGLNFNEVTVLNQEEFSETLLEKITPSPQKGYHAIHSYDVNTEYEVIDMARYTPKFSVITLFSTFPKMLKFQFSFHFKTNKNTVQPVLLNF